MEPRHNAERRVSGSAHLGMGRVRTRRRKSVLFPLAAVADGRRKPSLDSSVERKSRRSIRDHKQNHTGNPRIFRTTSRPAAAGKQRRHPDGSPHGIHYEISRRLLLFSCGRAHESGIERKRSPCGHSASFAYHGTYAFRIQTCHPASDRTSSGRSLPVSARIPAEPGGRFWLNAD